MVKMDEYNTISFYTKENTTLGTGWAKVKIGGGWVRAFKTIRKYEIPVWPNVFGLHHQLEEFQPTKYKPKLNLITRLILESKDECSKQSFGESETKHD